MNSNSCLNLLSLVPKIFISEKFDVVQCRPLVGQHKILAVFEFLQKMERAKEIVLSLSVIFWSTSINLIANKI